MPVRFKQLVDLDLQFGERREQRNRIEIALDRGAIS